MAKMEPYEIVKGDTFSYGADTYVALNDTTGEFNTYVQVRTESGEETEIRIPHGHTVDIKE